MYFYDIHENKNSHKNFRIYSISLSMQRVNGSGQEHVIKMSHKHVEIHKSYIATKYM